MRRVCAAVPEPDGRLDGSGHPVEMQKIVKKVLTIKTINDILTKQSRKQICPRLIDGVLAQLQP